MAATVRCIVSVHIPAFPPSGRQIGKKQSLLRAHLLKIPRKTNKINALLSFPKTLRGTRKVRLYRYALNWESTTYEPSQARTPLKCALLSNSAKIPCIPTPTLHPKITIAGNHAPPSPAGREFVHLDNHRIPPRPSAPCPSPLPLAPKSLFPVPCSLTPTPDTVPVESRTAPPSGSTPPRRLA